MQLDGSPERLTLAQGTGAGKATSRLREGSRDWVLREGPCPSLPAARARGTRQRNASVTLMSGSRQPKARPGQELLSHLRAPGLTRPREPLPTVLEKDLSRSCLPWALLSGKRLRLS